MENKVETTTETEKNYVKISTGRFREFEKLFKKISVEVDVPKNKEASNVPYIIAVIAALFTAIGGVAIITALRPDLDFVAVSGGVFLFVGVVITNIFTIIKDQNQARIARELSLSQQEILKQSQETHKLVNSGWDEFKKAWGDVRFAQGKDVGKAESDARTDKLSGA